MKQKKIKKKLELAKKSVIDGEIHFDLKMRFDELKKKVIFSDTELTEERKISNEKENRIGQLSFGLSEKDNQLLQVSKENEANKVRVNELQARFHNLSQRHAVNRAFTGRWKLTSKIGSSILVEQINFQNDEYRVVKDNDETPRYKIKLMDFDTENCTISFVKWSVDIPTPGKGGFDHIISKLKILDNDRYEGTENENWNVTYERVKPNFN